MRKRTPPSPRFATAIPVADLEPLGLAWLDDCEIRECSERTLESRRWLLDKLAWHLRQQEAVECGTPEIRAFLAYVIRGHKEPGGRWGNPQLTKPVSATTTRSYYNILSAFCSYLAEMGELSESPMASLKPPLERKPQIVPFSSEQVELLLHHAKRSAVPVRDEAIVWLLLDTGLRASEFCALRRSDIDLTARRVHVRNGKGGKSRIVPFGRTAFRALWAYLRDETMGPDDPFVCAERGQHPGEALTRDGLGQLIRRLGRRAGITGVRCSPHTFRHTFAVSFLRSGGNVFSLQMLLGHESLDIVKRYVALAEADLTEQHKRHSPADGLRKRKK